MRVYLSICGSPINYANRLIGYPITCVNRLIGSPINCANRLIGSPITSQSTAQDASSSHTWESSQVDSVAFEESAITASSLVLHLQAPCVRAEVSQVRDERTCAGHRYGWAPFEPSCRAPDAQMGI